MSELSTFSLVPITPWYAHWELGTVSFGIANCERWELSRMQYGLRTVLRMRMTRQLQKNLRCFYYLTKQMLGAVVQNAARLPISAEFL